MASDLQLHPAFDELKAATRVSDGKIVHPAPQDRIDEGHHRLHGLRSVSPKELAQLAEQRRTLLQLRRVLRAPSPVQAPHAAKVEPEEPEALAPDEIDSPALLLVDLDLEFGEFLTQSLGHRPQQPALAGMSMDQHHQIVREPRVLDSSVLPKARVLLRPLEHPVYLVEVEVAQER